MKIEKNQCPSCGAAIKNIADGCTFCNTTFNKADNKNEKKEIIDILKKQRNVHHFKWLIYYSALIICFTLLRIFNNNFQPALELSILAIFVIAFFGTLYFYIATSLEFKKKINDATTVYLEQLKKS